ncbi:MAG: hypothetical protein PPP55_11970 [Halorubrum sp.]
MTEPLPVAVPRKGRPLEAVLERLADVGGTDELTSLADAVSNTLRFEKAVTKGAIEADRGLYERLEAYSDPTEPSHPEFTLLRDDRRGKPRRIVFDSATVTVDGVDLTLIGREEPFRALRTHEFALGFDSADLVLEEVVGIRPSGLSGLADVNDRIDPLDTDVRVVSGLGDTVYHTLLASPDLLPPRTNLNREFIHEFDGSLCISARYERLVTAVLGTDALTGVEFTYPDPDIEEEAAIADTGVGVYLTVSGSTAREHGLILGEQLFPSETVVLRNTAEDHPALEPAITLFDGLDAESVLTA